MNLSIKIKASFTLEILMLMPFLLMTLLISVYLTFYIYDGIIINQSCYVAALRGTQSYHINNEEMAALIEEELYGLLKNQLYGFKTEETKVLVSFSQIEVQVSGEILMPLQTKLGNLIDSDRWKIKQHIVVKRVDPENFIRIFKKAEELFEEGKD
jgi:hypothetical protein